MISPSIGDPEILLWTCIRIVEAKHYFQKIEKLYPTPNIETITFPDEALNVEPRSEVAHQ